MSANSFAGVGAIVVLTCASFACSSDDAATGANGANGANGGSDGGADATTISGTSGADGSSPGAGAESGAASGASAPIGTGASIDGGIPADGGDSPVPGAGSGTTYYVSPSGNDSNDGLSASTAWQTTTKVAATTFKPGDSVLFEGGQTFTGCLNFTNSHIQSTRAAPFTVGRYGTGKFTLHANCSGSETAPVAAVTIASVNGFVLQDAAIVGNSGAAYYGVWLYNGTSVPTGGIVVRNCDITGFYDGTGAKYGGEIFITSFGSSKTDAFSAMDDIQILNNVLHGSSGPTSPDDGGINGYGPQNITNVVYDGNLVYDQGSHANAPAGAAGNGILAIGLDGVTMQNNVVHDVGANTTTCGGPAGLWTYNTNNALIQFNEVYATHPVNKTTGCDWGAYDFDQDTTNSLMQYNYSHDNYAEAFLMYGTGSKAWGTNVVRYNLSENDGEGVILNMDHGQYAEIYNNTVFTSAASTLIPAPIAFDVANNAPNMGLVANNLFVVAAHGTDKSTLVTTNNLDVSGLVMIDNDYYAASNPTISWNGKTYTSVAAWSAASGGDTKALAVDPMLVSAGTTGTCATTMDLASGTCGAGYQLAKGSPLLGAGLDLTKAPYNLPVGSRDFLGQAVPSSGSGGSGYNVGALSVTP